jgi:ATP-dependent Clp protease ATP-binding subunit ClpC
VTERRLHLHTLVQAFENDTVLAEALHYPEISRVAENATRARRALQTNARGIAERTPLLDLYRRLSTGTPHVREFRIELPPSKATRLWTEPLPLTFYAAVFEIPGKAWAAYFPALHIEVVADDEADLQRRVPEELQLALRRNHAADSLWSLAALQRCRGLSVDSSSITADIPSPKELAVRDSMSPKEPPVLESVAIDLTTQGLQPAYEYDDYARRIADSLSEPGAESVLLVGASGVGKTAAFHELVRRRKDFQFGHTPFWATSGSRLVAGMSGFGMWQERCDKLRKEASRTRAVIHLGNLVELMEVGKGVMIQQGMAGFLRPYIARGELLCVVECTPEQLPVIEREDPHLLGVFKRIDVNEPAPDQASAILMNVAHELSSGRDLIQLRTLETIDRLHRRYATYSAYPGRPLRFIRNLLSDREIPVADADVYDAFSRETGLPRLMLDPARPMIIAEINGWFRERIIGQDAAIDLVVDMLATVKAGLSRPRKPLASFLLIGPTGVGKTETSKALAEFLFNDRRRITRFDMSEYGSAGAVQRLIGGVLGEEGLLTARVREQPFSVLLFDEFEKAHPLFLDLLLQVLGEARLTDAAGRLADFSNTVVIMTSNLGAEGFMRGAIGFGEQTVDAAEHFRQALKNFVRPELLNRIDRIVPFLPLDEASVLKIVRRELDLLKQRPGIVGTGTRLEVSEAAERLIASNSYQPALGARPLKREIERNLLVPLAEALNTLPTNYALSAAANVQDSKLSLAVAPLTDNLSQPRARSFAEAWLSNLIFRATALRRKLQTALGSAAALRLRNEIYRLNRMIEAERRRQRKKKEPPSARYLDAEVRIAQVRGALSAFESTLSDTCDFEDRLAFGAAGRARVVEQTAADELALHERAWAEALRKLMRLDGGGHLNVGSLQVYSHHSELMFELARGYYDWARAAGFKPDLFWATREYADADRKELQRRAEFDSAAHEALRHADSRAALKLAEPIPVLFPPADAAAFLAAPREETGAIVIGVVAAEDAGLLMRLEVGTHRFRFDSESDPVNVDVRFDPHAAFRTRFPVSKGMANAEPLRRRYDTAQHQAQDEVLGQIFAWTGNRLDGVLARCISATFDRELERQVGL